MQMEECVPMNKAMQNKIIEELDTLPDAKGHSLLDYLHFLKNEATTCQSTSHTTWVIHGRETNLDTLHIYDSSADLLNDLGIEA